MSLWSDKPTVVMRFIVADGTHCLHNFYHSKRPDAAIDRWQHYEYVLGFVTWLEYK